jgi:tight adherence protein B
MFLTVALSLFTPLGVSFLFAVVAVAGIARVLVERKRGQRRDEFINQLPDVARVLSNGTSAGLSMAGAMELAARELAQPAATEMEVVVQETRLGMPLESSLERLRDRLPSREVAVLMTTLIIQQRAGGDTVRALSELGQTLEARKDLLREIRTMLSGAVFTSYLVAMMGAGTLVLVNLISPGIMTELTTTLPGILALSLTTILYVVAFAIIRGITKVEV